MDINNMATEGILFTIGNPLLDISTTVSPDVLAKYELKANDAILAEEKHAPLYDEIQQAPYTPDFIAGGATQNSARVAQALLKVPKAVVYTGCIGADAAGEKLKECSSSGGVDVPYMVDTEVETGKCAVLITDEGKARSLVTQLGAANNFKHSHAETPEVAAKITGAKVYYTAGFFQTVSPETAVHIGKHAATDDAKTFTTNLSAPFLMQVPPFLAAIKATLPYTDILFGNETEAATWAEVNGWEEKSVADIALKLSQEPKENTTKPRIVVFTQGEDATIVAMDGKVTEYPVEKCENLVDTNGAGDAFVGGFLSKLVLVDRAAGTFAAEDIAECVRHGAYAAGVIIQQNGCACPEGFAVPAKA